MSFICGSGDRADGAMRILTELAMCCLPAIEEGPSRCTCWETEYDEPQSEVGNPAIDVWPSMCDDCAFRPDSPERNGDDRYVEPHENEPFWCHRGMRKVTGWRHPAGIFVEADGDYYGPPARILELPSGKRAAVPFRADGTPAQLCAGWSARQRAADRVGDEA